MPLQLDDSWQGSWSAGVWFKDWILWSGENCCPRWSYGTADLHHVQHLSLREFAEVAVVVRITAVLNGLFFLLVLLDLFFQPAWKMRIFFWYPLYLTVEMVYPKSIQWHFNQLYLVISVHLWFCLVCVSYFYVIVQWDIMSNAQLRFMCFFC